MPIYTFYAHIGRRGAKIPILTIDHFPHDWLEMKILLTESATKAYFDHGVIEASWTLEKHVPTKLKVRKPRLGSYIPKPFSYKRAFEAVFHIIFNTKTETIEIKQAFFHPHNHIISMEYREAEKDKKYEIPPAVPKTFKSLLEDPKIVLQEQSALRYPDYSMTPKLKYLKETSGKPTAYIRQYLPWGDKIRASQTFQ